MRDMVVLELVQGWLRDEARGFNAQLAAVPRRAGDTEPPLVAPHAIVSQYDERWVYAAETPPSLPALVLAAQQLPPDRTLGTNTVDLSALQVAVGIYYTTRAGDAPARSRAGAYAREAVRRTLRAFLDPTAPGSVALVAAERTLRNIEVVRMALVADVPLVEGVGDATTSGAVLVTLDLRDLTLYETEMVT